MLERNVKHAAGKKGRVDFAKNREDSTFFDMEKGGAGPDAVEFLRIVQVLEVHAGCRRRSRQRFRYSSAGFGSLIRSSVGHFGQS